MRSPPEKTVADVARELGKYSIDAFEFLKEGLDYTVQRRHGESVHDIRKILMWLDENGCDESDLPSLVEQEVMPAELATFITEQGGPDAILDRLNLHVGGAELCEGLRELACERWGLMAPAVLNSWGVRTTHDFGRLVFALVDSDLLQKQPEDVIEDFTNVYDFKTAFETSFRIDLTQNAKKTAKGS
ncbi:MAG: Minf_1886 family protein [Planctomycetota bacterium]